MVVLRDARDVGGRRCGDADGARRARIDTPGNASTVPRDDAVRDTQSFVSELVLARIQ